MAFPQFSLEFFLTRGTIYGYAIGLVNAKLGISLVSYVFFQGYYKVLRCSYWILRILYILRHSRHIRRPNKSEDTDRNVLSVNFHLSYQTLMTCHFCLKDVEWSLKSCSIRFSLMVLKLLFFLKYVLMMSSQCTKRILNEISKPLNETFTGLMSKLQGFRICFVWNLRLKA